MRLTYQHKGRTALKTALQDVVNVTCKREILYVKITRVHGGIKGKVKGSTKSVGFIHWVQLFQKFNLDQNDPGLKILCFAIQDQLIHLTFVLVFQSNIGLDHPDLKLFKITKSRLPGL